MICLPASGSRWTREASCQVSACALNNRGPYFLAVRLSVDPRVPANQALYRIASCTLEATAVAGSTSVFFPSTPLTTAPRVLVTLWSATCPACNGQRKIAVAIKMTINAHPIAAAVVARALRRARSRITIPSRAITAGTQVANRLRCSELETCAIAGSKMFRKVGLNATAVIEEVSAAIEIGMLLIQLLNAVPITASG